MTTEQVAAVLGIHPEVVRRWIRSGRIKGRLLYDSPRLGYRVKREDLIAYLRDMEEEEKAQRVERGEIPELVKAS